MLPQPLKKLVSQVSPSSNRGISHLLNSIVALAAPIVALLTGHLVQAFGGNAIGPLAPLLPVLGIISGEVSPLARISYLIGLIMLVTSATSFLLYWTYRITQRLAVDFELEVFSRYRSQIQRLAQFRTLSARQNNVLDGLEYHLPRIRFALSRFWLIVPRHPIQLVLCMLLAFALHLPLAMLTIIGGSLLYIFLRLIDRYQRVRLPVTRENASRTRGVIVNVCLRGPLLNTAHEEAEIDKRFDKLKELYQRYAVRSLTNSAWRIPAAILGLSALCSLLVFVVAVQWIQSSIDSPQLATLVVSLFAGGYSFRRLLQVARELKQLSSATQELNQFFDVPVPEIEQQQLVAITRVNDSAELEHATVQDSQGRKLLEDVTAVFQTGQLIAIVAEQTIEAFTLAELLIGLGRPTSGRMLVDGLLVTDLKLGSLTRCSHWISADGGIVTGTIAENLRAENVNRLEQALKQFHLSDLIIRMSEGIHTLITQNDDRLSADEAFRIGIARAGLRNSSIVIVEEPEANSQTEEEQKNMESIRSLVGSGRISVVLPQRLATLRQCDQIILLRDHRIQDIGSHAELIQKNEFYRHLIYLRFNAFRS